MTTLQAESQKDSFFPENPHLKIPFGSKVTCIQSCSNLCCTTLRCRWFFLHFTLKFKYYLNPIILDC